MKEWSGNKEFEFDGDFSTATRKVYFIDCPDCKAHLQIEVEDEKLFLTRSVHKI